MMPRWLSKSSFHAAQRSRQRQAARPLTVEMLEDRCTPAVQFASSVQGFSSQFSTTTWSAAQALGAPDTLVYGDTPTAWAPSLENVGTEFLYLGFATPVYADGAVIRETYGNGFVKRLDVVDVNGLTHKVWEGTDPSLPGEPVDFAVAWTQTHYLVTGLFVQIDSTHTDDYEEIDAVQLSGEPLLETYASTVLGFSSQFDDPDWSAQQALGPPDTDNYGDFETAWAAAPGDGTFEFITLGFDTPLYASGVVVRETNGNGFVTRIDIIDGDGHAHIAWTGTDPGTAGTPQDIQFAFPQTNYLVHGVTIYTNTDHMIGTWEEIDAVSLQGTAAPLATYSSLSELPATGVKAGSVLSAVLTNLQKRLTEAATAQTLMRVRLAKAGFPTPTSEVELRLLSSSVVSIAAQLAKLNNGRVTSVTLAPGVVLDQAALDLVERYLKFIFLPPAGGQVGFDPRTLIPSYQSYQDVKRWYAETTKKIDDTANAVTNAQNTAIKWLTALLSGAGQVQSAAHQEAKLIAEGGLPVPNRLDELNEQLAPPTIDAKVAQIDALLTGAPTIFTTASTRLKAALRKSQTSAQSLKDHVVNLAAWLRNQVLVGNWYGLVQRTTDNVQGDLTILFKAATARGSIVSGTLTYVFYVNGRPNGRTTGSFTGSLDAHGVFRGNVTVKNSSGSATYVIAWDLDVDGLHGTLYEGQALLFATGR